MAILKVIGGFFLGIICGIALAVALSVAAAYIFNISQMEGAYAMAVAFFYAPIGGLMGGIIGAIWMAMRSKRQA
jgi:hypothetical protein